MKEYFVELILHHSRGVTILNIPKKND